MEKIKVCEIEALIDKTRYIIPVGTTTTICLLTLKNGFVIHGVSACLNLLDFDSGIGESIAHDNAFDKIWQLEGYHRASIAIKSTDKDPQS